MRKLIFSIIGLIAVFSFIRGLSDLQVQQQTKPLVSQTLSTDQ